MARVLITGGAGYVGSHCAKAAALAGHDCVVFDNLLFGHKEFVRWGPLFEGDIRDQAALQAVLSAWKFDAVMHFAALAYVGQSVVDPGPYYDVNVNGTRVLLEAIRRAEVPYIVFSSSCAIYGQPDVVPIVEDTPARPINPYGFTKLVCEHMLDHFEQAHDLRSVKLRYFNAAGADPDGQIGEDHDPETHLIPLVLEVANGQREFVPVYGNDYSTPDGTAVRDYIHVCDLATAHVLALRHLLAGGGSRSYNLGTGSGASVQQVIDTAFAATGRPIRIRESKRRQGDPARLIASADRANAELGWSTTRSDLETVIRDAWNWHSQRFRVNA